MRLMNSQPIYSIVDTDSQITRSKSTNERAMRLELSNRSKHDMLKM